MVCNTLSFACDAVIFSQRSDKDNMVAVINSSINLFQQGLRFEKNQTEDDMDKVRQKYCELASRELLACKLLTRAWGLGKGNGDCPYKAPTLF